MTYLLLARKYWKLASLILLALLLAVQTVRLGAANNRIDALKIDINELRGERDSLIAANEAAKRLNKAEVAKREAQQEQINEEVRSDYQRDLARLHDELRRQAAKGGPGKSGVSQAPTAPGGTPGEAGVCLAPSDYVRAAENELRHDKLIDWARQIEAWWNSLPKN